MHIYKTLASVPKGLSQCPHCLLKRHPEEQRDLYKVQMRAQQSWQTDSSSQNWRGRQAGALHRPALVAVTTVEVRPPRSLHPCSSGYRKPQPPQGPPNTTSSKREQHPHKGSGCLLPSFSLGRVFSEIVGKEHAAGWAPSTLSCIPLSNKRFSESWLCSEHLQILGL